MQRAEDGCILSTCEQSTWADQHLKMDTSEVTIAEFSEFADAVGLLTKAEKEGGMVYESGWVTKKGWNWRTPYGVPSPSDEPAVHIISFPNR